MFATKRTLIVSLVAVGLLAASSATVQGAAVTVSLEFVSSFDASFTTDLGNPLVDDPGSIDPTDVHTFGLNIALSGMGPLEDFQSVGVNIDMGAGFSPEDFGGFGAYFATPLLFDPPGPAPPGDVWFINTDASTPNDLQNIFVVLSNIAAAAALQPGEPGPLEVGQFSVNFDPVAAGVLTGEAGSLTPTPEGPWFTWNDGQATQQDDSSEGFEGLPFLVDIPEPSSLALLALGGLAMLRRRA